MDDVTNKSTHKSIRFPVDVWLKLEVEASKADISTSEFIRAVLEEALNERSTHGVVPSQYWARWSALSEAAGYKSVVAWVDALIQKSLGGSVENRPNFDQIYLKNLAHQMEPLFKKEEGEVRHIELSATLETFVLLRLWLEKNQPELIPKAHALAEEHYREAKAKDKGQCFEPVLSPPAPIALKRPTQEMALS